MLDPGAALYSVAWDRAERLAAAVQTAAGWRILLYATQLRPMMTAELLGIVSCGDQPSEAASPLLHMHASSHGAVLAILLSSERIGLVPLLYRT